MNDKPTFPDIHATLEFDEKRLKVFNFCLQLAQEERGLHPGPGAVDARKPDSYTVQDAVRAAEIMKTCCEN